MLPGWLESIFFFFFGRFGNGILVPFEVSYALLEMECPLRNGVVCQLQLSPSQSHSKGSAKERLDLELPILLGRGCQTLSGQAGKDILASSLRFSSERCCCYSMKLAPQTCP